MDKELAGRVTGPRLLRTLDHLDAWYCLRSRQAEHYEKLFRTLQPTVVFSTASVIADEWIPLFVAQKMGIKLINFLRWHKTTVLEKASFKKSKILYLNTSRGNNLLIS